MTRKDFFTNMALFAGGGVLLKQSVLKASTTKTPPAIPQGNENFIEPLSEEIANVPTFCSHEHWGSLFSMNEQREGFTADVIAGAKPATTNLIHLMVEPYFAGNLIGDGKNAWQIKRDDKETINIFDCSKKDILMAWQLFEKISRSNMLTGAYFANRIGISRLYGVDINHLTEESLIALNQTIGNNYAHIFEWYTRAMKKMKFTELIRPVHPEFFYSADTLDARKELQFTKTLMRIDPLLGFWKESERRNNFFNLVDYSAGDAESWRRLLEKLFAHIEKRGCIGIKQMQAYFRNLDFEVVNDKDVTFSGDLSQKEITIFANWMVNECCKLAHEKQWPHQIHVGTHNMPHSNPLPLKKMSTNYPKQKIVQLHCWPYQKESGFLAKTYPNIFIDTCWQVILNPEFLRESLHQWLHYVPLSKITMSNDSTSVEMAAGSNYLTKKILLEVLKEKSNARYFDEKFMESILYDFMHNNAVDIYNHGSYINKQ